MTKQKRKRGHNDKIKSTTVRKKKKEKGSERMKRKGRREKLTYSTLSHETNNKVVIGG